MKTQIVKAFSLQKIVVSMFFPVKMATNELYATILN